MPTPLGIRLNNPLNIEHGQRWVGLASEQPHKRYCAFVDMHHGVRAGARILANYRRRRGIKTIRQAIERWAPPHENDSALYVRNVCQWAGLPADREVALDTWQALVRILPAMMRMEVGAVPLNKEQIRKAVDDALS